MIFVLLGSALSIAALIAFNAYLRVWTPAPVTDLDAAARRLVRDYGAFSPGKGVITADQAAALIEEADADRIGLIKRMGDGWTARRLAQGDVLTAAVDGPDVLLRLRDHTFPPLTLRMPDAAAAETWGRRLRALKKGGAHA